jgi:hypothetical protein
MSLRYLLPAVLFAASAAEAQSTSAFWQTVKPRLQAVRNLSGEQNALVEFVSTELHRLDPRLTCELGTGRDGVHELIISADGLSRLIPAVRALVASAPPIKNWRYIAFRPRVGTSFGLTYDSYDLKPEQMWFRPEADSGRVGLWLYLPGVDGPAHDQARGAALIMLDMAIGELATMTKVGFIEFRELPPKPQEAGLRPIGDLPSVVDTVP